MKALVLRRHGGLDDLDVVTDYPTPQPGDGEVVIRVRAASFNYHDVFTMRGMPGIKVPLPVIIGLDMAGEIAALGAGVAGWKTGDRVLVNPVNKKKGLMGEMLDGGMAEYCRVAADQLVAMPDGVTFEQAAALPVAYGTAHRMLITHGTVKAGDTRAGARRLGRRRHRLRDAGEAARRRSDRLRVERGETRSAESARRRSWRELSRHRVVEMGDRKIRQAAAADLRRRRRRRHQFHRRRHLGAVVALPQARRQAAGMRRHRGPRPRRRICATCGASN